MVSNVITAALCKVKEFSEINKNFVQKLTLKGLTAKTIEVLYPKYCLNLFIFQSKSFKTKRKTT